MSCEDARTRGRLLQTSGGMSDGFRNFARLKALEGKEKGAEAKGQGAR